MSRMHEKKIERQLFCTKSVRIAATIFALVGSRVAAEPLFSGGPLLASLTEQADSAELGLGIEVSFDGIPRGAESTRDALLNVSQAGASYATGESCMLSGDYTCAIFSFIFRHRKAEAALLAASNIEVEAERNIASASATDFLDRPSAYESAQASANLAFVLASKNRLFMLSFESVHIFKRSRRLLRRCLALCDLGLAPLEGHPAPWLRFAAKISENPSAVEQGQALRNKCAETLTPFLWEAQTPMIDEPTEPLGTLMPWGETMPSELLETDGTQDRQASGIFALLLALYGEYKSAIKQLKVLCNNVPEINNLESSLHGVDDACKALLVVERLGIAHHFLEHGINGPTSFEDEEIRAPKFVAATPMIEKYRKIAKINDEEAENATSSDNAGFEPDNCVVSSSSEDCMSAYAGSSRSSSRSSNNVDSSRHSSTYNSSSSISSIDEDDPARPRSPPPGVGMFLLRSSSSRRFVEDHRTLALTIRLSNQRYPSAMTNCRLHVLAHGSLYGTANHSLRTTKYSSPAAVPLYLPTSVGTSSTRTSEVESRASVNATLKLVTAAEVRLSKWWMEALGSEAGWLLGGVHVLSMGRLPFRPADLNYLRKIFTILVVCRSRGYGVFISLDDDVLLSPAALAAMVAANGDASADVALRPRNEGGLGCAMVAPTLSTGIPTVEAWMEDSLPKGGEEAEALNQCFAQAATQLPAFWSGLNMSKLATAPLYQNIPDDERIHSSIPWNASSWYASVWEAAAPKRASTTSVSLVDGSSRADTGWLDGPIASSLGAGVHPVRRDLACTVLAFRAARARLATHFGPLNHEADNAWTPNAATIAASSSAGSRIGDSSREAAPGTIEKGNPKLWLEASTGRYPYMCNSAWASTPEHLMAALAREDLASFAHPFDEASMSAHWLHENQAPLCVLRGAFGVHPLYGGMGANTNESIVDDAPGGLEATMHRETAVHLRAALDIQT